MRRFRGAIATLCAICALAAPAAAQEILPDYAAYQDMTLARVRPGMRAIFYHDGEVDGCPAPTPRCQRRAYVVAGDLVLLGAPRGSLVKAAYSDAQGRPTEGWILRNAVEPIPTPRSTLAAWRGHWNYDEADIDITPGKRPGRLKASGNAIWGGHDPERVKNGGIHMGEFDGEAAVVGDRILFRDADGSDVGECRVSLRLIGPYLVAADNNRCGGLNVSFSGFYRRTSAALRLAR